jgi:release factor glutamine methyltransferase
MPAGTSVVPLIVELELTEDQQRQILEQTGISIGGILFETTARSIRVSFAGLTLQVPTGVFVPTSATEHTCSVAVEAASQWPAPVVVDVGTGCGAVALSIAHSLRSSRVYGTDISDVAVHAARRNRTRLSLKNVRFLRGSLLSPLPKRLAGGVNVIVANAPHVPPRMSEAVAGAFPEGTAIGLGSDGLDLIREIADTARGFLVAGGSLVLQLADFQWPTFSKELTALGYSKPRLSPSRTGPVAGKLDWNYKPVRRPEIHVPRSVIHD